MKEIHHGFALCLDLCIYIRRSNLSAVPFHRRVVSPFRQVNLNLLASSSAFLRLERVSGNPRYNNGLFSTPSSRHRRRSSPF